MYRQFQEMYQGFSFYHLRKSDDGADPDAMFDFCLPQLRDFPRYFIHQYGVKFAGF